MRTIRVSYSGGPEVLTPTEVAEPACGDREILVDVAAAGVNFIDIYQREGLYPVSLPYTPGLEGAGIVRLVGARVKEFAPGDHVAWTGQLGSYAEVVALPAEKAVAVPNGVRLETAAGIMVQGLTAHYLVTSVSEIKPGDTALVHAAAGGVGLLLTQMIKARGGVVIGTVSTETKEKAALAAGADYVIRYDQVDFMSAVRDYTNGLGADVVYDGVGASTFDQSLRSLKVRGTLALFGQASGPVGLFDPQILNSLGSLVLTRPSLAHFTQTPHELQWRADEVFEAIASGDLTLTVGGEYPLGKASQAHIDLESRKTSGKLLLIP
jgi:NADPH:quinone reductase